LRRSIHQNRNNPSQVVENLIESMDTISKAKDNKEIYSILENMLKELFEVDGAEILLYDKDDHTLHMPEWKNGPKYDITQPSGLMGRVLLDMEPKAYNYAISEKDFDKNVDMPMDDKIKAIMYIPITDEDESIIALIRLYRKISNNNNFNNEDINLVRSIMPFLKKVIRVILGKKEKRQDLKEAAIQMEEDIAKSRDNNTNNNTIMDVSSMVHDIRTPANALSGFLELLEEIIEDKRILEYIKNAKESAEFINTLTTSILDKVKYGSRSDISKIKDIYTNKYFASIAETFTANMFSKNIDYHIYIDPSLPSIIKVDTFKLKRVLMNLIGNAWKFTPQGKSVTVDIRYSKDKKHFTVSIIDTGLGIPEEKQQEIFEAFKQIDEVKSEVEGSGLGLSIVQKYVRSMGGEMELKSKPDIGSVFKFSLPLDIVDASPNIPKYEDLSKQILILTNKPNGLSTRWIKKYITEFGLPLEHISIDNKYIAKPTHTIVFESLLNDELLEKLKVNGSKIILYEENFLSLTSNKKYHNYNIISKGTYYGEKLFKATYHKPPVKILIVDDNKINLMLLNAILENERCITDSVETVSSAKTMIDRADVSKSPYQIIFLDKYLPDGDGDEIAKYVREHWKNTLLISITGDPNATENKSSLYDTYIPKPFKKQMILDLVRKHS